MLSAKREPNRRRSSSVTTALQQVPLNRQERISEVRPLDGPSRPRRKAKDDLPEIYHSLGFWTDLKTGRWMAIPSSSFKLMLIPALINFIRYALIRADLIPASTPNPVGKLLWLSGELPNGKYRKHVDDLFFVLNHVVFWSFVRQFMTIHVIRPIAIKLGVPRSKQMRFMEQGYAIFYMGIFATFGITVMKSLPIWWYKTEHMWLEYPHRELTFNLKLFYLLQASYWLQQLIIMGMRIEKPRKDYNELIAHHFVTLYLIFWSYVVNLTYIGVAIFVTMDFSDVFLALSKCVNYVNEPASQPVFAVFIGVWTYFRHYLNLVILWSVWNEYKLIPEAERTVFNPFNDQWADYWLKYMIFLPIALLQMLNLFWYFLILRIMVRTLMTGNAADERSDGEEEDGDVKKDK